MAVQLIVGRAGSGKTEAVLDEMAEKLREQPLGSPLIYLVPEQASFQGEMALGSKPGLKGTVRAQVLSFKRLAYRVMQETGGTIRTAIDDLGKTMLIQHVLQKHKQELSALAYGVEQLGTIERLLDLFNEFKRYCITPDELRKQGEVLKDSIASEQRRRSADKLNDLALLYGKYESLLMSQYLDGEDVLNILAEQIPSSTYIRSAEIWIDGFHGFTPQEYRVIGSLMKHCKQVKVTVCSDAIYESMDELDELNLFYPTAVNQIRLQQLIEEYGVDQLPPRLLSQHEVPPRYVRSSMLAHLEQQYERRGRYRHPDKLMTQLKEQDIQLLAAPSKKAEAESVAREILYLVREKGVRWKEIAILSRNLAEISDMWIQVFQDFEIPFFLDQNRVITQHPLIEFIRSALEVVQRNWRYESLFRCIKTDFLLPLQFDDTKQEQAEASDLLQSLYFSSEEEARRALDELENYVLAFGIQGYRWTDKQPWTYRYSLSAIDDERKADQSEQAFLHRIHKARMMIVNPLQAFQRKLERANSVQEQVAALYELLERVQAQQRLEKWSQKAMDRGEPEIARQHQQIWNRIMDVMDQFVEIFGNESLSLEWFDQLFSTGVENVKMGLVPPAIDQVTLGSLERSRPGSVRYAFIVGANDGVLPAKMTEDGLLSEGEREMLGELGMELAPTSRRKLLDEQFLIYSAITVASDRLYISYPLSDEEGKALLPSELVRRIQSMFPSVDIQLRSQDPDAQMGQQEQLRFLYHPHMALSHLIVQLRRWMKGEQIDDIWWDAYNWFTESDTWRKLLRRKMIGLFHTNQEKGLRKETSRLLYGNQLRASVSRMERFAACPFAHFAAYGLKLKERKIYRLEAPDIGQLFHAALTYIAVDLEKRKLHWGDLTPEQCRMEAEKAVDHLSPKLQSEILLSSKRYHYINKKLKEIVGRASEVLGAQARRGEFTPVGLELGFGPNEDVPSLVFKLSDGATIELLGRIDRVDQAEGEDNTLLLRIIDYKSSSKSLQLPEVFYGLSLQLLTYLDVVVTHAKEWLGKTAKPAGVLYFHVHNPLLQSENSMDANKAQEQVFKKFKMKGLVMADLDIVRKMDGDLEKGHSEILPVAVKKDGSFYSNSSVLSLDQWEKIRAFIRNQIKQMGADILNGHVEVSPYKFGKSTPCEYCPYHAICQFDPLFEENDYRNLSGFNQASVWQQIESQSSLDVQGG